MGTQDSLGVPASPSGSSLQATAIPNARLEQALTKAFRMGACSIHVPDQAERIAADFAAFVFEQCAAPRAEPPHHCAPQDIAVLVARLEALADPEQEAVPSFADTDWRTLSSVCHRVINYLVDLAATPTFCDVCDGTAKLEDIEHYRLQMAGISTAALGYWKEGDGIHPDYDTVPLRDVAKLYAKYDELFKMRVEAQQNPPSPIKPLSDEQLMAALVSVDPQTRRLPPGFRLFARAIEAAHGITA